jgi:hypothetical protein
MISTVGGHGWKELPPNEVSWAQLTVQIATVSQDSLEKVFPKEVCSVHGF